MDVNPERGEVAIILDGKLYPMRPSFEAILAIEQATGLSLQAIIARLLQPQVGLTMTQLATIATEGVKAAGKERDDKILQGFKVDRVAELIYRGGFLKACTPVEQFLVNASNGGAQPNPGKKTRGRRANRVSEADGSRGRASRLETLGVLALYVP